MTENWHLALNIVMTLHKALKDLVAQLYVQQQNIR